MKKGLIIGLGSICFVVVFAVVILSLSGSSLSLNQNEIPRSGIKEIQSELDYIVTLLRTEESAETKGELLVEEMMERPSVINTCTKISNQYMEGLFEMKEIEDYNSDGAITSAETEWAVENTPKLSELYEHEEVTKWCIFQVKYYPDKFPNRISDEEIRQKITDLQD